MIAGFGIEYYPAHGAGATGCPLAVGGKRPDAGAGRRHHQDGRRVTDSAAGSGPAGCRPDPRAARPRHRRTDAAHALSARRVAPQADLGQKAIPMASFLPSVAQVDRNSFPQSPTEAS